MDPQINPYAPPTASVDQTPGTSGDEDYVVATRGARLFGAIIDFLFALVLMAPLFFIFDLVRLARDPFTLYMYMAVPMLIYAAIQWTLIATSGQSIGKKLLGTKIVMLDGSDCGFVHGVILRSWITGGLNQIPTVGKFIGLIDALWIFGSESRCLHDMIAGTRVIVAPIKD